MDNKEKLAALYAERNRLTKIIERAERLKLLFDNPEYKELEELYGKKAERYLTILNKPPKVGAMEVWIDPLDSKNRVPYKITNEDVASFTTEFDSRIDELKLVLRLPKDLQSDRERSKEALENILKKIEVLNKM